MIFMHKKVIVAMSGGVDSTVAAHLIKQAGYGTAGITMRVWSDTESIPDGDTVTADQNCSDAANICAQLGIEHHIVSYGESFKKQVIKRFLNDYINGFTPNPCVECNKTIKFGKLFDSACSLGFDTLATGHYARIAQNGDTFDLCRAKDTNKDQSYFLWSINKNVLAHILFPLGEYTKPQIREIAEQNGYINAHRSDSQDICFIENGKYARFISEHTIATFTCGDFIDIDGNIIGKHSGIINYTIGQRKGLGVAFGKPMFVGKKDALKNTVMLCTDEQLYSDNLTAKSINILVNDTLESPTRLQVKIRYRHSPAMATVQRTGTDTVSVKFDLPQRAIAPGQSAVFYDGNTVVGGGIIQ